MTATAVAIEVGTDERPAEVPAHVPPRPVFAPVTGYYSLLYGASHRERRERHPLRHRRPPDRRQHCEAALRAQAQGRHRRPHHQPGGAARRVHRADGARARSSRSIRRPARSSRWSRRRRTTRTAVVAQPGSDPQDWEKLIADPTKPMLNRSITRSIRRVDVQADHRRGRAVVRRVHDGHRDPGARSYHCRSDRVLQNFGGESCSGQMTLEPALKVSCNTAFAMLGVKLGQTRSASRPRRSASTRPTRSR